jgi:hypothetical protein
LLVKDLSPTARGAGGFGSTNAAAAAILTGDMITSADMNATTTTTFSCSELGVIEPISETSTAEAENILFDVVAPLCECGAMTVPLTQSSIVNKRCYKCYCGRAIFV